MIEKTEGTKTANDAPRLQRFCMLRPFQKYCLFVRHSALAKSCGTLWDRTLLRKKLNRNYETRIVFVNFSSSFSSYLVYCDMWQLSH